MKTSIVRGLAALGAVAALALVGGAARAAAPTLTITSPASGAHVSLKRNPYLAVAGGASFAEPTAGTTTFYLRRDGCGTANDNPHLSVTTGTDGGDGCGLVLTVVGTGGDVDQGAFVDYPSTDGMPLTLDSGRAATGVIDLENLSLDDAGIATGIVTVDVTMEALVQGQGVAIGSDSESVLVTPGQRSYPVAFHIQPNGTIDKADLSGVDLRVHVHGPYAFSGFIGNSGKSRVSLPSWSASFRQSVEVSLDDPGFGQPVPARVDGSTWSVAIPTPPLGKHVIYARGTQGFDTSAPVSQAFTPTK